MTSRKLTVKFSTDGKRLCQISLKSDLYFSENYNKRYQPTNQPTNQPTKFRDDNNTSPRRQ